MQVRLQHLNFSEVNRIINDLSLTNSGGGGGVYADTWRILADSASLSLLVPKSARIRKASA